jgi:hypothetical protein
MICNAASYVVAARLFLPNPMLVANREVHFGACSGVGASCDPQRPVYVDYGHMPSRRVARVSTIGWPSQGISGDGTKVLVDVDWFSAGGAQTPLRPKKSPTGDLSCARSTGSVRLCSPAPAKREGEGGEEQKK